MLVSLSQNFVYISQQTPELIFLACAGNLYSTELAFPASIYHPPSYVEKARDFSHKMSNVLKNNSLYESWIDVEWAVAENY